MIAGAGVLSTMDAVAKWLVGADYSVIQVLAVRGWIIVAALILWMPRMGGRRALITRRPWTNALRVGIGFLAPYCFFSALKTLPLADATAIFFSATFIMTALSVPVFGERVGVHRWSAVIIGFIGVIVVTRPGGGLLEEGALYALGAAVSYALLMVSARWLGKTESVYRLVFFYNAGLALIATLFLPWSWTPMAAVDLGIIAVMAALGLTGHVCLTRALKLAPLGVVAPFDYTALIWATALGYLVWGDVPRDHVLLGSAIIVASGLYVIRREARLHRQGAAEPRP